MTRVWRIQLPNRGSKYSFGFAGTQTTAGCAKRLVNNMLTIRKAAIIGAGNMGAQIAAHLANVGIPSLLLDVPPSELTVEEQKRGLTLQHREVRNRVTKTLFERARKLSPTPFFVPEAANLI